MKIIKSLLTLFLAFLVTGVIAQVEMGSAGVPMHKDVVKGELANGLKYFILENPKPENKVELRLVVNAGSILETEAQQGLAHFVEHMAFNGTENFKKNELVDYLQSVGVKFGAHLNAYTSFDETVYMLSLPSDDKEIVDKGFQILGDWAGAVSFEGTQIDKERGVVLEEYRLRLGAENRMMEEYLPKLLFESRYAERLPIGKKEVLENFDHDAARSFYKDWYRPNLMAVIVVGDIDKKVAEDKIQSIFSKLKNPSSEKERKTYDVPDHSELLVSVLQDPEASRNDIQIIIKKQGEEATDGSMGNYRSSYDRRLISAMFNARLRELMNKPDAPLSYSWSRMGSVFTRSKNGFMLSVIAGDGMITEAYMAMLQEIERVRRSGFLESELERVLKDFQNNAEAAVREAKTTDSRRFLSGLQNHFLEGSPFTDPEWRLQFFNEYKATVSLENLNAIAKEWLGTENAVVVITSPEGVEHPDEGKVMELWNQASEMEIEEYVDNELPDQLIDEIPLIGGIEYLETNKENGVTELRLSNGAKVLYKKTDFKADQVLFQAFSKGGLSVISDKDFSMVRHGIGVIGSSGVGQFSESDLEKMLSGKRVFVAPYVGSVSEGMNGSCSPKDLEELFQLTHLFFTQPRMDEGAWETYRNRQMSITANMLANPTQYYRYKWSEFSSEKHVRNYKVPTEADWGMTDYQRIYEINKERFAGAADFTFVFVGNFDEEQLQSMIKKYIGSIPAGPTENYRDVGLRPKKGTDELVVKKGTEPKSMVNISLRGEAKYNDDEAWYLKSLGEVLKIKLTETLREEMSGVYGSSAYGGMGEHPYGYYYFGISFPCGPENVDALKKRALSELKLLVDNGPSEKDLNKVKEAQLLDHKLNLKSNRYWLNHIKNDHFSGKEVESMEVAQNRIKNMTAKNLQDVGKKYLQGDYLVGILMPE